LANPVYTLNDTLGIQFQLTKTNKITGCSNQDIGGTVVRASPKANFTFPKVCFPSSVTFADSSYITGLVTDANDVLNSWKWYFGDAGASPALSDTSDLQNPLPYNYSGPGLYNVKLVVQTGNNCMDSITKPVNINSLTVAFTGPTSVCSGKAVSLTNTSTSNPSGTLSCVWNFGDGSPTVNTTNLTSPGSHTFPVLTTVQPYIVSLTVSAANGCSNTFTQTITVYPVPDATITSSSTSACFGNNITLDVDASYTSTTPYKVIWKNLTNNTVLSTSPQTTLVVSTNGIYRATVVDTVGGCADSASVTLNFLKPPANLAVALPTTTCANAPLKLISTVSAGDSLQFKWVTSNGTGTFSNDVNDTTFYTSSATDPSSLTFTVSAYNRCDSLSSTQSISLLAAAAGSFTYTPIEPFMNDLITFVPDTGTGGNYITKWFWDFKEGNAIDSVNYIGTHAFLHGGSFPVTLTLINIQGCSTLVVNLVEIKGSDLYIPNVFEPSTINPENSVCKVYGRSIAPDDFSFKIYDKWGSVVYQTSDFIQANQTGWNGKNLSGGDPLPMGVYTYAVKGRFFDGSNFEKAGTVTLIR
jgi:hypothetical protein